jgi:hypothetical protein
VAGPNRLLNVRLFGIRHGVVKLYGVGGKYKLQSMELLLDPDVDRVQVEEQARQQAHLMYTPSPKQYELKDEVKYFAENDQLEISGLPAGDHVLTLKTPDFHMVGRFSLSHIVVF